MAEVPIAVPVSIRDEVVPSRKRVKLPPWLEIAKPRLIPLLLATTLGGMALSESWPLPLPRLACTLGGGAGMGGGEGGLESMMYRRENHGSSPPSLPSSTATRASAPGRWLWNETRNTW